MQIDLLAEISQSPRILSEVDAALKAKQMKADVDEYLKVFSFVSFIFVSITVQGRNSVSLDVDMAYFSLYGKV
jgi:capsular polysaccharide biosynthesis protein